MTRQRDFKALVRERMAKTGERYSAARAQLLSRQTDRSRQPLPGILRGYDRFGGIQGGTAALCNALRHAGITSPLARAPYTETIVNGLCGGPGFLYAVFEYKGWPPLLSLALQSRSMPDVYVGEGLTRLGLEVTRRETTSSAAARKALDEALASGKAAICVVDIASLPWSGLPKEFIGGGPHVVTVAGRDGESYWIDDRASHPLRVDAKALAAARAAYRGAKNRLATIDGPAARADLRASMADAIADTALRYVEPAVPKSFWVNCGFSGLAKWRQMLTDRKDKTGWPAFFAEGAQAHAGLQRAYESIECQLAPGAGRYLYADFLDDAAAALGRPALARAAVAYREAGAAWSRIGALIAGVPDKAVREACAIADQRLALGDTSGAGGSKESAELWNRRTRLASECRLSKEEALAVYAEMAVLVGTVIDAEHAAVDAMTA
jgi:Butirosin biosynthesis protein H, N-terminal/Domain of unknown function (DUF4872)